MILQFASFGGSQSYFSVKKWNLREKWAQILASLLTNYACVKWNEVKLPTLVGHWLLNAGVSSEIFIAKGGEMELSSVYRAQRIQCLVPLSTAYSSWVVCPRYTDLLSKETLVFASNMDQDGVFLGWCWSGGVPRVGGALPTDTAPWGAVLTGVRTTTTVSIGSRGLN